MEVKEAFLADTFLWGFVVAWSKSDRTGGQEFIEGQWMAMKTFKEKRVVTAPSRSGPAMAASPTTMATAAPAKTMAVGAGAATGSAAAGSAPASAPASPAQESATAVSEKSMAPAAQRATKPKPAHAPRIKPADPVCKPVPVQAGKEAMGSKPAWQIIPAITVGGGKRQQFENNSGSDEEYEDDEPEESDANVNAERRIRRKLDNAPKARGAA